MLRCQLPFNRHRIYGRKSCTTFMGTNPILIDISRPMEDLVQVLTSEDQRYLSDGFVLVDAGLYAGSAPPSSWCAR